MNIENNQDLNWYINFVRNLYLSGPRKNLLVKISKLSTEENFKIRPRDKKKILEIKETLVERVKQDLFKKKEEEYKNEDYIKINEIVNKIMRVK